MKADHQVNRHRVVVSLATSRRWWQGRYCWSIERKTHVGWEMIAQGRADSPALAAYRAVRKVWFIGEADRVEFEIVTRRPGTGWEPGPPSPLTPELLGDEGEAVAAPKPKRAEGRVV